jgi:hypothetical protein
MVPIVIVGAAVFYALVTSVGPGTGTLVVNAYLENGSGGTSEIRVQATVDGNSVLTPYNATMTQGPYTVTFPQVKWYVTPPEHSLVLESGKTAYAVGIYTPIKVVIGVSQQGFNDTEAAALHSVTPVEWVNTGTTSVTLSVGGVGDFALAPGQGFTWVFQTAGTSTFSIIGTQISGKITIS